MNEEQGKVDIANEQATVQNTVNQVEKPVVSYVRISADKDNAWLCLTPKEEGEYTKDEIIAFLKENGVQTGFHDSNIMAMCKKRIYNREILVAVGKQPEDGKDGYFEFFINTEDYSKHPKINQDGSVDYMSMSLIHNVGKGDLIAEYHPAVKGPAGYDVCGKFFPSKPVKDIPSLKGKDITEPDDKNRVYALIDGKVKVTERSVEITSVHEIKGDVDYIIGRIDFGGDILISGNVGNDVTIRAGKTITINGTVGAARIEAGGDIIFKRGIQGNEKAIVISQGNVFADFIEQSSVSAKGNIQANSILNSKIEAQQKVILTGKRGTLLGGETHALMGIEAACIGNDSEIRTILRAGVPQDILIRKVTLSKLLGALEEDMKPVLEELLTNQKRIDGKDKNPMYELKMKQLRDRRDRLESKRTEYINENQQINQMIEDCRNVSVVVNRSIFRGTVVFVNNASLLIDEKTSFTTYTSLNGIINEQVMVK